MTVAEIVRPCLDAVPVGQDQVVELSAAFRKVIIQPFTPYQYAIGSISLEYFEKSRFGIGKFLSCRFFTRPGDRTLHVVIKEDPVPPLFFFGQRERLSGQCPLELRIRIHKPFVLAVRLEQQADDTVGHAGVGITRIGAVMTFAQRHHSFSFYAHRVCAAYPRGESYVLHHIVCFVLNCDRKAKKRGTRPNFCYSPGSVLENLGV